MKRIAAVVALLALTACGSHTPTVDHAALVHFLHVWAVNKQHADPGVKVSCPDDIPQKAGTTFHCLLHDGGQTMRVTVTVENDQGYLTWVAG